MAGVLTQSVSQDAVRTIVQSRPNHAWLFDRPSLSGIASPNPRLRDQDSQQRQRQAILATMASRVRTLLSLIGGPSELISAADRKPLVPQRETLADAESSSLGPRKFAENWRKHITHRSLTIDVKLDFAGEISGGTRAGDGKQILFSVARPADSSVAGIEMTKKREEIHANTGPNSRSR